jgi:hypothetical protein
MTQLDAEETAVGSTNIRPAALALGLSDWLNDDGRPENCAQRLLIHLVSPCKLKRFAFNREAEISKIHNLPKKC